MKEKMDNDMKKELEEKENFLKSYKTLLETLVNSNETQPEQNKNELPPPSTNPDYTEEEQNKNELPPPSTNPDYTDEEQIEGQVV
jgi:hypothetical protein